ncbi:MAG: bifunctional demethylmenaquinone methyltransferase/2-methoxy-6-polyprenyl-1,4-benzoquinol methylase UbiE [Flavisolibacter sp.]
MNEFPHDVVKPFKENKGKKEQVGEMFDAIAGKYDFMNRLLTIGIDVKWRRKAIMKFMNDQPSHLLDVATGTGDMAIMAMKLLHPNKITGIDISEKMLELGKEKVENEGLSSQIQLVKGDSETINFPNNTFDGVMVAFGVRNFENLEKGLLEILRVLKPGGRLVVLECSKPRIPGIRTLYNWYMGFVVPQLAKWFSQSKKAYQYLNRSVLAFPDRQAFVSILSGTGFSDTECKPLSLGICCIYSGRKPIN